MDYIGEINEDLLDLMISHICTDKKMHMCIVEDIMNKYHVMNQLNSMYDKICRYIPCPWSTGCWHKWVDIYIIKEIDCHCKWLRFICIVNKLIRYITKRSVR